MSASKLHPTNHLVNPMLTDLYQLTMCYAYWQSNRQNDDAVYELFFRKNPFKGEYTIYCGLDEVLKHVASFKFTESDIEYLKSIPAFEKCNPAFFDDYLAHLDCSQVKIYSLDQGRTAFPRVPLLIVVAPLGIGQLLETTLLTLINYPSLVATNAARMVVAARGIAHSDEFHHSHSQKEDPLFGLRKSMCVICKGAGYGKDQEPAIALAEFGLRRAQGPDGGFSATKYSLIGGFDSTSNVLAGKILGVPIAGTHAHAFVQSFVKLEEADKVSIQVNGEDILLLPQVLKYRNEILGGDWTRTNDSELAAFIAYAGAFPHSFLALVDTYDTLNSGIRNFILVALALDDNGYTPKGIRLDSGDLSYLSLEASKLFREIGEKFNRPFFKNLIISASNDIDEEVLYDLNKQGHAISLFGIGTNLVTCENQPALGCVYKLVEINGTPRMKLSQSIEKVLIPGKKDVYRLYGVDGRPLLDLMIRHGEDIPEVGNRILCRHPFDEKKRVAVIPSQVLKLHKLVFDGSVVGDEIPTIDESKKLVKEELKVIRSDILRRVNPGSYKVSVSENLYDVLHTMWHDETPVMELR